MIWTIVLAAGSGSRFGGGLPKQYEQLGGCRVLDWSLRTASAASDAVVVVADAAHVETLTDELVGGDTAVRSVVAGGARRSDSVRAGLVGVPPSASVIVVHDAARPLASIDLFGAVTGAVRSGADGAVPGIPVVDTLKRIVGGRVVETVDREGLVTVQTPQAFEAACLRLAHADGADATDDAALVERVGGTVVVVPGEADNVKITVPDDLARIEERSR